MNTANEMTFGQMTMDAAARHSNVFLIDMVSWLESPVNFLVWATFRSRANAKWEQGFKRYSARTIGETIRFDTDLSDSGTDFKLNDHLWPDLARLYMLMNPEREGFFEFRGRRAA